MDRRAKLAALYTSCFPTVARYVRKRGASFEEARDIFQEALLIYYEKVLTVPDPPEHRPGPYLFGIARHLWIKSRNGNAHILSQEAEMHDIPAEAPQGEPSEERLLRLLQIAGKKCMELLTAFYYEKLDMGTIASRFGFSGARSATVQKFKCLEKVKETVKEKSLDYEDFLV